MEPEPTWTCSCGAQNTSDVFTGTCTECGISWADAPEPEEHIYICPRSTIGGHACTNYKPENRCQDCPLRIPVDKTH